VCVDPTLINNKDVSKNVERLVERRR
jgi:hypothetical protein